MSFSKVSSKTARIKKKLHFELAFCSCFSRFSGVSEEARDLGAGIGRSTGDFSIPFADDCLDLSKISISGLEITLLLSELPIGVGVGLLLFLGDAVFDFGDFLDSMISARSSFRGVFFRNGFDWARSSSIESSTLAVFVENGLEPERSSSTELSSLSGIDRAE